MTTANAAESWTRFARRLPVLIVLIGLCCSWFARAGEVVGLPIGALKYADLALVPVAAILAFAMEWRRALDRFTLLTLLVASFAGVGLLSGVVTEVPFTQSMLGIDLYLMPFLAALTVALCADAGWVRLSQLIVIVVVAVQVPLAVGQFLRFGPGDPVQGSMIGAGAGAHLLGALALVAALMLWRHPLPPRRKYVIVGTLAAVLLMVLADAKQVIASVPIAVIVVVLVRLARAGHSLRRTTAWAVGAFTIAAVPIAFVISRTYIGNILRLTIESEGGKVAVVKELTADLRAEPLAALIGFGPGETVSRLAWLLSGPDATGSAPLLELGFPLSERAAHYREAALGSGYVGESSFSYALSSVLGLVGDYGVLGLGLYLGLCAVLGVALLRSGSPLGLPVLASGACLLVLGVIGDWLEQTPITLIIGVLAGCALREPVREPGGRPSVSGGPPKVRA